MDKTRVGLLPLYLELYDRTAADKRPGMERFVRTIADELGRRGLEVIAAPVCRLEKDFNRRAGFGPADDRLPAYFANESLPPHGGVWHAEQRPPISACDVTPPSRKSFRPLALSGPGLNIMPPVANATPARASTAIMPEMIPNGVRQPRRRIDLCLT